MAEPLSNGSAIDRLYRYRSQSGGVMLRSLSDVRQNFEYTSCMTKYGLIDVLMLSTRRLSGAE
jgi:hypothetical protein